MQKINFEIQEEFIELIKLLKATGICGTGGEAKMVVEDGLISVNNETEFRKRYKCKKGDIIVIDNVEITIQ